jgi:cytoskeleton protein RodZ
MTNEINSPEAQQKLLTFCAYLKATRESQQLDTKQIAASLKLTENVIINLESNPFVTNLPTMFLNGYLRNYAKLLNIPAAETRAALSIPETTTQMPEQVAFELPTEEAIIPAPASRFTMTFSTYAIGLTMIALFGSWWFGHSSTKTPATAPQAPMVAASTVPTVTIPTPATATPAEQPAPAAKPAPQKKLTQAYANTSDATDDNDNDNDDNDDSGNN